MKSIHRTIIVPDCIISNVRHLADSFGPDSAGMWTTPLSPTGELPATHWISAGQIDDGLLSALQGTRFGESGEVVDVSIQPPFDAMATLGLLMVRESDGATSEGAS